MRRSKTEGKSQLCDAVVVVDRPTLLRYSLLVSNLKLPRPVPQKAPIDPFWDFTSDVGADGLGGVLH